MSPIVFTVSLMFILSGCDQRAVDVKENNKSEMDKIIWKRIDLYEGKSARLTSPYQLMTLSYFRERVTVSGPRGVSVDIDVTPPASILWRPNGKGVAINNGNGSGQMSELIIIGDRTTIVSGIEEKLKSYFFDHASCRPDPKAVSVSAEGWSIDSSSLWVRFESWDRQAMCNGEPVNFAQYDVARGQVLAHLTLSQAMGSFCRNSEFRELYGPNCNQHD